MIQIVDPNGNTLQTVETLSEFLEHRLKTYGVNIKPGDTVVNGYTPEIHIKMFLPDTSQITHEHVLNLCKDYYETLGSELLIGDSVNHIHHPNTQQLLILNYLPKQKAVEVIIH